MLSISKLALPFPRRNTAGGGRLTLNDTTFAELEGKVFEVPDTVHNTGVNTLLMAVKNDTGGAMTVARTFGSFSAAGSTYDLGRRIGAFPCVTQGGICLPLDDAYTVGNTIPQYDIFYVVLRGWCTLATLGVANFAAHMNIASSALGVIRDQAQNLAGEFVVGTLAYAAAYAANSTAVVWVDPPSLALPPA